MDDSRFHEGRISGQNRATLRLNRRDRCLAANAAARSGIEMSLETIKIDLDIRRGLDVDGIRRLARVAVAWQAADTGDLVSSFENSLGEQESDSQLEIVAGRPHGDADGLFADRDLQRFLDGEQVLKSAGRFAVDFLDRDNKDASVHRFLE